MRTVIIFGRGNLAREVLSYAFHPIMAMEDADIDNPDNRTILSLYDFIFAFGNPQGKQTAYERYRNKINFGEFLSFSRSLPGTGSKIGKGSLICPGSIITVNVQCGLGVTVNMNCTVGHDVTIGDFSTLSPGVHVSGNVKIGARVLIGTGACIAPKVSICDDALVGIGSVVVKDITEPGTYFGNPCRRISL